MIDGNIRDLFELYPVSPLTDGGYGSQPIMLNHNIKNTTKTSLGHTLGKKTRKNIYNLISQSLLEEYFLLVCFLFCFLLRCLKAWIRRSSLELYPLSKIWIPGQAAKWEGSLLNRPFQIITSTWTELELDFSSVKNFRAGNYMFPVAKPIVNLLATFSWSFQAPYR